ncbi:MAG: tRNA (adenosine(37)-N6)-threonylcarbamoyltransferase complex transferase subunit TsaD [Treponema sp.]|nr:tRNA (adenosine(37)-N6)-threonylcarbamoyltransferase complex transferase subunit TsaD [Treponema sp.]MCL2271319.1 tRNA (adenosine(37)-N6)-threonylcarbamoyltransferase complex transferase subunit TsaD [Treponema sp.]
MKVLGIETSCDECSASVVEDGEKILSNVIMTQIPFHAQWNGVVPEIASRKHVEWIYTVAEEAIVKAELGVKDIDAVAATNRPGLFGSLLVGLSFAKAFAWARNIPFIAVDHMLAHLYAPRLSETQKPEYPFLGLLVSGGHTIICRADDFDNITVMGTTIDDAAGEAFDKVSKFYGFGYPGGEAIDKLSRNGDSEAFRFPLPSLHKGGFTADMDGRSFHLHRYDVSYSGLKTAVVNQLEMFKVKKGVIKNEDIAASFQKTAVEILLRALLNAAEDTGLSTIVAGGGVAANSLLRSRLAGQKHLRCIFPPLSLCGDNGAMIAGIGYQYLARGERSPLDITPSARVTGFKKKYP